jgi:hypothetical protein
MKWVRSTCGRYKKIQNFVGVPEGKRPLENVSENGRMMLKMILKYKLYLTSQEKSLQLGRLVH